ncbi:MAG: YncE family protein [Myxococcales bacterium]|nr:YncE family protein [Myxococcales bacterium]
MLLRRTLLGPLLLVACAGPRARETRPPVSPEPAVARGPRAVEASPVPAAPAGPAAPAAPAVSVAPASSQAPLAPPSPPPAPALGTSPGPEGVEPLAMAPGGPPLEVARRVRTGVQPKSIALSPTGDRLYVCNFGLAGRRNVSVYDAQSLEPVGRIDFPGNAAEAAVSADGATVYVSNFGRGLIEVVDAASLRVTHEIAVGHNPKFMVIDEERRLLYVSNWSSRSVSAVDLAEHRVDHTLHTGRRPRGMALLDDGTLMVGAMWDHRVQVYAPGHERPDREFPACENPRHLVLSPDQSRLYVSCSGDWLLRWFDPHTGEVLVEAPTGRNPRTIDISADGRFVAVADFSGSTVSLVDLGSMHHRTHEVARTKQIVGLAVAPGDALRIFVTSWLTNELIELRPAPAAVASRA